MNIESWMDLFLKELQNVFKNRLVFVGLQGSRGRGEGRPDSDIDVVVVLDRLTPIRLWGAPGPPPTWMPMRGC